MSDAPVNLNRFRKARDRAEARQRADENAVKFGRTKSQKARDTSETTRLQSGLDQAKREE